jgi:hypothetical protein
MCLWVGPHQAVHGRPVERVNLLKQKAAARGRGACAGNGPLPGAASADGGRQDRAVRRVRDRDAGGQQLGARRTEEPDQGSCPLSGPTRLPVASALRKRGGLAEGHPVRRGPCMRPPADTRSRAVMLRINVLDHLRHGPGVSTSELRMLRRASRWRPVRSRRERGRRAPALRAHVDRPTGGRHAVSVVAGGAVRVRAEDIVVLARVDERGGGRR